jgi:AbrB family looped-hinge helix DNA binding protein
VSPKFQISLPKALRERLGLKPGDHLVVEERDGNLVLSPAATVPRDQLYFWSRRWQEGEGRAEADLRAGRVSRPYGREEAEKMTAEMFRAGARKPSRRKKP